MQLMKLAPASLPSLPVNSPSYGMSAMPLRRNTSGVLHYKLDEVQVFVLNRGSQPPSLLRWFGFINLPGLAFLVVKSPGSNLILDLIRVRVAF
jgi:hypothetical protein